jgi:TolB-like protein/Tfp pilus assembly protein PilF
MATEGTLSPEPHSDGAPQAPGAAGTGRVEPPTTGDNGSSRFWTRVKEHKVVQWTVGYGAAAYTLLHVVEMVSNALDWPHIVVRIVTLSLILGVPVAATLAWYHGQRALRRVSGPELAILTVLLVIAGSVLWFLGRPGAEHARAVPIAQNPASNATGSPPAAGIPEKSIAVLPFVDMSEKHDQEYFGDGMAEEVIDGLTRIPQLKVIGRTSSFQFKGHSEDLRTIGEKLGAVHIVEGSVRKTDLRIRVTAQLIDTRTGTLQWSDTYDRELGDVLMIQGEVSANIARALQLAVLETPPASQLQSPEAYTVYLRARRAFDTGEANLLPEAQHDFEQALALDPTFARAAEGLALTHLSIVSTMSVPSQAGWPPAVAAAETALRLDPRSSFAHVVLGIYHSAFTYDWASAMAELDKALALNPRDSVTLYNGAWLAYNLGRNDDALRLQDASLSLDPLNPDSLQNGAIIRFMLGQYDTAQRDLRKGLNISPQYASNHRFLGQILLLRGDPAAALKEMEAETSSTRDAALALAYWALGRKADSDAALARMEKEHGGTAPVLIAEVHAYRGERDQAFEWLRRSVAARDMNLVHRVRDDPLLASLRSDPRYTELLRAMNLVK